MVLSLSLLASYLPRLLDVPLLPWPFLLVWGPFVIALLTRRRRASARAAARNHRLTIAYLGGGFAGWQRQINALSVQEVVETALERLVGEPVRLHGASRTDAGVHAAGQEAHVTLARSWPARTLVEGTNHYLPSAVRVLRALAVAPDFHAREWAVAKEYHYRMSRRPVLLAVRGGRPPCACPIDSTSNDCARRPRCSRDATTSARSRSAGGSHRQTFRRVFSAEVVERGRRARAPHRRRRLPARHGPRAGRQPALGGQRQALARAVARRCSTAPIAPTAGPSAPAHGLVLMRVFYPEEAPSGNAETPRRLGASETAGRRGDAIAAFHMIVFAGIFSG